MSSDYPVLDYNDQLTKQFDQRMLSPQLLAKAFLENQKLRIDNKFSPLETLIKAQNAQSYGSSNNPANEYLRYFNSLPPEEKSIYLADPDKNAFHEKMMGMLRTGASNSFGNNYLNPQVLQQYYPELGNNIAQGMNAANQNNQAPQQSYHSPSAVQNLTNTLQSSSNTGNAPQMNNGGGMPNYAAQSASVTPENNENSLQTNNVPNSTNPVTHTGETHPSIKDQPLSDGIKSLPVPSNPLSEEQRRQYAYELAADNKLVSNQDVQRANGAATLHLLLLDPKNRQDFSNKINNALQYVGAKGRGKAAMNSLLMKVPSAQVDYDFVTKELNPNLSNNITMMENLSSGYQQQKRLLDASNSAYTALSYGKDNAKQLINNYLQLLLTQGSAAMRTAEPLHPGARAKLLNIPEFKGDYILPEQGKVYVTGPNGTPYEVSEDQAKKLLKDHPTAKRMQ